MNLIYSLVYLRTFYNLVPRVSHFNAPGVKMRDPGNEVELFSEEVGISITVVNTVVLRSLFV